ncbi:MAG: hypothetical protein ACFFCS_09395 [Candidatus Hodarchaeota archaeon]
MKPKRRKISSTIITRFLQLPEFSKVLLIFLCMGIATGGIMVAFLTVPEDAPDLTHGVESRFEFKGQDVLYYIPNNFSTENTTIFFVIHGASRTYESYFERWMAYNVAEEQSVVLIAPHFDVDVFSHYQVLNAWGIRADLRLIQLFDSFTGWLGLTKTRFFIFGFSGGGQFVHRFTMVHPELIERAVAGAAGSYTFPDASILYQYGTGKSIYHPISLNFNLEGATSTNMLVIVGDQDILRTENLDQSPEADAQGLNRLERAQNWFAAMNATAVDNGWTFNFDYHEVPGAGHSSSAMMPESEIYLFGGP